MTTETAEAEKPSSMAHGFRISLNLTRRIVRRMIELDQSVVSAPRYALPPRISNVPDSVSFQFSLRVLRRVVHRLIEQTGRPVKDAQPA